MSSSYFSSTNDTKCKSLVKPLYGERSAFGVSEFTSILLVLYANKSLR